MTSVASQCVNRSSDAIIDGRGRPAAIFTVEHARLKKYSRGHALDFGSMIELVAASRFIQNIDCVPYNRVGSLVANICL
jgi:hypothetical protein